MLTLILRQGLGLVLAGVSVGLVTATGLGKLLSGLLFGVDYRDAATFLFVTLVLATVGVAASVLPAYRASRVDFVRSLNSDY